MWSSDRFHQHGDKPQYFGVHWTKTAHQTAGGGYYIDESAMLQHGNSGWLQMDLGFMHQITAITTIGRPGTQLRAAWVTSYTISVSIGGYVFENVPCEVLDGNGWCTGNVDQSTQNTNYLKPFPQARYVRLYVKDHHEYAALRMGVSACPGIDVVSYSTPYQQAPLLACTRSAVAPHRTAPHRTALHCPSPPTSCSTQDMW